MNRTGIAIAIAAIVLIAGAAIYLASNTGQGGDSPVDPGVDDMNLILEVDGKRISVIWEDSPSVDALKVLAKDTLTISMERYGGFEQTGGLPKSIVRNDTWIQTGPGDIVLYRGSQISIFFDDNAYDYTKLGRITGMSPSELTSMLDKPGVTVTFSLEPEQ